MVKKITNDKDEEDKFLILYDGTKYRITIQDEKRILDEYDDSNFFEIDGNRHKYTNIKDIMLVSKYYEENPQEKNSTDKLKETKPFKTSKAPDEVKKKFLAGLLVYIERNEANENAKARFKDSVKNNKFNYKEIKKTKEKKIKQNEIRSIPGLGVMLVDNFKKLRKENAIVKETEKRWAVNCEYPKLVKRRNGIIVDRIDKNGNLGLLKDIEESEDSYDLKWFPREFKRYTAERDNNKELLDWFAKKLNQNEYQYKYFAV